MAFGELYDFLMGQSIRAYQYFGAHFVKQDNVDGVVFRLYAPMADDVSVIGDWNSWDVTKDKMHKVDDAGVYEVFIPGLTNYQSYKYHFKNAKNRYVDKADPFAFFSEIKNNSCSRLFDNRFFAWHDDEFLKKRNRNFDLPMSIYEMHMGSWHGSKENGNYPSYEEVCDELIPYLKEMGYTHVELMPLCQYPFDGSWGYQATGFYSVDSRYGNPFQLMSFVDRLHQENIGVILDFAPVHFATDKWALKEFDGTCLYEYSNKYKKSPWGSYQFDLGKDPVRSFLMSAMNYYIDYFHFDGLRIDAVSNIIYYNGNKNLGQNDGAIEFIKRLNGKIHIAHDSVMMIAEDSSDYEGVTRALESNGLGFDYKWDLGWMNDTLYYYSRDPIYKKYDHNKLTFSMAYFYSDNFLLPFSHDEIVHGKGSLVNKMFGSYDDKFAQLRNLMVYQLGHPGKKLNFMSNEIGSFDEWNEARSIVWDVLKYPHHSEIKRLSRDINAIYRKYKSLYFEEYNPIHFNWLMVDNKDQSVFAFRRIVDNEELVFVFNMTPNFYKKYNIPLLSKGTYEEILNTNKKVYGGNDLYNGLPLKAKKGSFEGLPYHLEITLNGYTAIIFKRKQEKR